MALDMVKYGDVVTSINNIVITNTTAVIKKARLDQIIKLHAAFSDDPQIFVRQSGIEATTFELQYITTIDFNTIVADIITALETNFVTIADEILAL